MTYRTEEPRDWDEEEEQKDKQARWDARRKVLDFIQEMRDEITSRENHMLNFVAALETLISREESFIADLKKIRQEMKQHQDYVLQVANREKQNNERTYEMHLENNNLVHTLRTGYSTLDWRVKQLYNILPKCPTCGIGLLQFHSDGSVGRCQSIICPTNQGEDNDG